MKKKISILVVFLVVIIGAGIVFYIVKGHAPKQENTAAKSHTTVVKPQLGTAQTIDNKKGQGFVTIAKSGYYDITVVSADNNTLPVGSQFPEIGQTEVGTYFGQGDQVNMFMNAVVKLSPAKFAKLSEPLTLKYNGGYLVGLQFPAGTYQATLVGHLGTDVPVYINTGMPDVSGQVTGDSKNYELTSAKPTISISVKNGERLDLSKMTPDVTISLKK